MSISPPTITARSRNSFQPYITTAAHHSTVSPESHNFDSPTKPYVALAVNLLSGAARDLLAISPITLAIRAISKPHSTSYEDAALWIYESDPLDCDCSSQFSFAMACGLCRCEPKTVRDSCSYALACAGIAWIGREGFRLSAGMIQRVEAEYRDWLRSSGVKVREETRQEGLMRVALTPEQVRGIESKRVRGMLQRPASKLPHPSMSAYKARLQELAGSS